MKQLAYQLTGLVIFVIALAACSTGACFENIEPKVVVHIYSEATGALKKCDSIKVIGVSETGDTLLVDETSVSNFSFSIDPMNNESTLYFLLDDLRDTVTLTYSNYPHIISPECGYTIYSDILTVTFPSEQHKIDTIRIENKSVTLDGERNLLLVY